MRDASDLVGEQVLPARRNLLPLDTFSKFGLLVFLSYPSPVRYFPKRYIEVYASRGKSQYKR
jgi:hypothetical protein